MRRLTWHTLPLLLVILFICIGRCVAQEAALHADQAVLIDDEAQHEKEQEYVDMVEQPKEVQEAVELLSQIKPTVSSRSSKPQGAVSTTIHYAKELFTLLFLTSPVRTSRVASAGVLPPLLADAVALLEDAAKGNSSDALYLLAELNFYGNYSHPVSYPRAFNYYKRLADATGNSTAQYMLGFIYATGLNPEVGQDQAKSMLYHTFAAHQHNTRSEMTLAYRYHAGISTSADCERAVRYYRRVADKAVEYYRSGPPGGHSLVREAYRLADEAGGVYGEGASFYSAGLNARQNYGGSDSSPDDVLEYLLFQSSKGDLHSTYSLARFYYDGDRGLDRDMQLAKKYFMEIARQFWDKDGKIKSDAPVQYERLAPKAAGQLGRMFLRGEGMKEPSHKIAHIWLQRGVDNGDALSQYSLGLTFLQGLGVNVNVQKAADLFSAAADQKLAVAQTEMGILFLDQGDSVNAQKYFEFASSNQHIEAFYYLAEIINEGINQPRSCRSATVHYKIVAEKAEPIWASLGEANEAYKNGDKQKALIGYLMAAEMGSENAQANVAWILDESKPEWSALNWLSSAKSSISAITHAPRLALRYWVRSARQSNIDSIVKMGDYYLSGLGVSSSSKALLPQPENAAVCYQAASGQSAQAMWNLGWMHENGLGGVKQDFHLAKRFYDQALLTNQEAYLPVKLSLLKLRWRSWWNKVTFGKINSIQDDEEPKKARSFWEWLADFLEADAQQQYEDLQAEYEQDDWETGGRDAAAVGEDEYYSSADEEDDLVITLIICGLIGLLFWLFYYRQQQQRALEERRRAAQANGEHPPPPPQDRGLFPAPGDPAWNQWVAGGIGH